MTLYKYLTADRADILELGLNRYTQPVYLNDPFEMTPHFAGLFSDKALMKQLKGKARKEAVENAIKSLPPRFHQRARLLAWLLFLVHGRRMRENLRSLAGTFTIQFRQQFPQMIEQWVRRSAAERRWHLALA
jgi:hypothetical protein